MKIIEPNVELVDDFDATAIMRKIERAGRVCYKSEGNIKDGSAEKFIRGIIKRGHESVIEHATVSFKIVCDRGVTHELVRHRIGASYSQESTRYCVAGDMKLTTANPHFNVAVEDLWTRIQNSRNGSWKRILIKQLNESSGLLEYAKIKTVVKVGVKDVFQIVTDLGYKLKCTADHEIYTPQGYVKLSELSVGEKIFVNGIQLNSDILYRNYEWLYYQNITLGKTFTAIAEEFGYNVSTLKKWARKFSLPQKGTGYFNVGRKPWNKGLNLEIIFADEIKNIQYIGSVEVYDIEMNSPYHNFVANSVIVHNCDYSAGKFGGELTFIKPCFWSEDDENFQLWLKSMELAEKNYLTLRANGAKPEEARSVLPNSLKTEIFVTMNLREWRHFLKLRTAAAAHPQMREVALKIYKILAEKLPAIFDDIQP